jgi:hypothetical protein
MTELGYVTEDRLGPVVGVPGRVRHRRSADSLVHCTGGTGMAILWFQHGRCEHGRSLVPSTGEAWPGREKRRRRTKERREEEERS